MKVKRNTTLRSLHYIGPLYYIGEGAHFQKNSTEKLSPSTSLAAIFETKILLHHVLHVGVAHLAVLLKDVADNPRQLLESFKIPGIFP
jgi:hypothetical protein